MGQIALRDIDLFFCFRIARYASSTVLGSERAEAAQFYTVSVDDGVHHEGDKAIHHGFGLDLRQTGALSNLVDDFRFRHGFWVLG